MPKSSVVSSRPAGNGSARASLRTDPPCIDLAERFGRRYRVEYEPAYSAQYGPRARVCDPWLRVIPCRAGHICPWGGPKLAAVTDNSGPTVRKLAALPGVTLLHDGSDGATVLFNVADFARVAKIMHPRRCRRLSAEQRAKLAEAGAKHRFSHGAGACRGAQISTQTTLFGPEAAPAGSAVSEACFSTMSN
jgi:hypothetical protein